MNRRQIMTGLAVGSLAAASGGISVLRLHASPRRRPSLTDEHLDLLGSRSLPAPSVLFIGNSMVLNHDLPRLVAERALRDGTVIGVATAAATGARLIETWRIDKLNDVLVEKNWDVLVLQDFTKTPLRFFDRWGSGFAIRQLAHASKAPEVVLYPPFPAAKGNPVYEYAGILTDVPDNPEDFAARTTEHYSEIAAKSGFHVAPVPTQWLKLASAAHYSADGHHPSLIGARLVADILWSVIRELLPE